MGTWGPQIFENDTACDFANEVLRDGVGVVEVALGCAADLSLDDFELEKVELALAGAETVARMKGDFGTQRLAYTGTLDRWLAQKRPTVPEGMDAAALTAVDQVMAVRGAVAAQWQKPEDFQEWLGQVEALRQRLARLAKGACPIGRAAVPETCSAGICT